MKEKRTKYLLLFALLFTFIGLLSESVQAKRAHLVRNQGVFYSIEGIYGTNYMLTTNYLIDTDAYSPSSFGLKSTVNWFINYHLSAGAGLGVLQYQGPRMYTLPILVNTQAYLSKGSNTPFAYLEGGYGFRFNDDTQDKGFLYEYGLGFRYRIKWNSFLAFKVGYHNYKNNEWQWQWKPLQERTAEDPYQWYNLRRQTITFTLALYFSTRY